MNEPYPPELTAKIKRLADQLRNWPDAYLAIIHVIHSLAANCAMNQDPIGIRHAAQLLWNFSRSPAQRMQYSPKAIFEH